MNKIAQSLMVFFSLMTGPASELFARDNPPPLEVVAYVDLDRYLGKWYEIASIPQWFQRGCVDSQAEYSKLSSSQIRVVNTCQVNGRSKVAKGKAWIADPESNAKLKVQFFWPFKGDYWIIELDADYQYAVVGEPGREALWILSKIEFTHFYDTSKIARH